MSRYIEAETLKVSITRYAETFISHKRLPIVKRVAEEVINDVCFAIDVQKSEDVVPVVRCKDCKHRAFVSRGEGKYYYFCEITDRIIDPDWYCADGESTMSQVKRVTDATL